MLEVSKLSSFYGPACVVRDVSLSVPDGQIVAVSGRNGAGKTTLLRSIVGLHANCYGSILLDGAEILRVPVFRRALMGVGFIPDDRGIYSTLSVEEHLLLPKAFFHELSWSLEDVYRQFPDLQRRRSVRGTEISGGQQQMLAVARVLRMGSRLILCDELTEGLAPSIVDALRHLISRLCESGVSVLLVDQNFWFVSAIANKLYILENGSIRREFSRSEMCGNSSIASQYLGV